MADNPEMDNNRLQMSAVEIQQEYFEAIGDVDWELYEPDDRKYLLQKIAVAMCGPPKFEGNLVDDSKEIKLKGYELRDEELTMAVFNKIIEQAKYSHNNENILISFIRVVSVTPAKEIPFYKPNPDDYWLDLHEKKGDSVTMCIFHVFGVRKCISRKIGESSCRIYIDHEGRVYKNWQAYLKENKLPKSVMIVPENGKYKTEVPQNGDRAMLLNDSWTPKVKLSVLATPALGGKARILSVTDTANTVANVVALLGVAVGAASIPLMPVVAPVAFGISGVIAVSTGVYGIIRSSIDLADRGQHQQPIGLNNSEARGSWVNMSLSVVGISFSAAGKLLSMAASTGTDIKIFINAFQVLKYTNLVTGFIGVVNSLGDMIYKFCKYNETPTTLELFQLTSSALFFGLGVMSNQTAESIVKDAQAKTINEARNALSSKNKRKMFDKATAETRRIKGPVEGNADNIRALIKIKNKDDFFAKLGRSNKDMNKNKVRVSLSPDGEPLFNNKHKIDINKLDNIAKKGRSQLFSDYGPSQLKNKNAPTRVYSSMAFTSSSVSSSTDYVPLLIRTEELIKITKFVLKLTKMEKEYVAELLSQLSADIHDAFLLLCAELFSKLLMLESSVSSAEPHYKMKLIYFVFNFIKSKIVRRLDECDYENDKASILVIKEFFQNGRIKKETILLLISRFEEWWKEFNSKDSVIFDDIEKFKKMFEIKSKTLEAGNVLKVGKHQILIKETTIELLSKQFLNTVNHQYRCDLFINFCISIITAMSSIGVEKMGLINPDEDLLMIVAKYFIDRDGVIDTLLEDFSADGDINMIVVEANKNDMLEWLSSQNLRKYKDCMTCKGICYADA